MQGHFWLRGQIEATLGYMKAKTLQPSGLRGGLGEKVGPECIKDSKSSQVLLALGAL